MVVMKMTKEQKRRELNSYDKYRGLVVCDKATIGSWSMAEYRCTFIVGHSGECNMDKQVTSGEKQAPYVHLW